MFEPRHNILSNVHHERWNVCCDVARTFGVKVIGRYSDHSKRGLVFYYSKDMTFVLLVWYLLYLVFIEILKIEQLRSTSHNDCPIMPYQPMIGGGDGCSPPHRHINFSRKSWKIRPKMDICQRNTVILVKIFFNNRDTRKGAFWFECSCGLFFGKESSTPLEN